MELITQMSIKEKKTNPSPSPSPSQVPLIVLSNLVFFPMQTISISSLGGIDSKLLQKILRKKACFGIVYGTFDENGKVKKVARYGTEGKILALIKLPNGEIGATIQGTKRFKINKVRALGEEQIYAEVNYEIQKPIKHTKHILAQIQTIKTMILNIVGLQPQIPQDIVGRILTSQDAIQICYLVVPILSITQKRKIKILSMSSLKDVLAIILKDLAREVEILKVSNKIQDDVKNTFQDQMRKGFLTEQLSLIKKELNQLNGNNVSELDDIKKKISSFDIPKDALVIIQRELEKLEFTHQSSPEYQICMNYLNTVVELPWGLKDEKDIDGSSTFTLAKTKQILDRDHYGLEKVKDQILEHLALIKHKKAMSGQIILLVGPPGVGKTSLGKSIADALNRKFVRVSLGGVKDESEIRGHRKTYIGSMPGKIIQGLIKAKSNHPVLLLDEIDKTGSYSQSTGDVDSALLEVLDPEQNKSFTDHFLNFDFDLSGVLFIATANQIQTISPPLRDRLEIIELSGYTENEKTKIAQNHLLPKVKKNFELDKESFVIDSDILKYLIQYYTKESGVRRLRQLIEKIGRNQIKQFIEHPSIAPSVINAEYLQKILGPPRFLFEKAAKQLPYGVAIGLAYTPVGGDILYIESKLLELGSGNKVQLTGSLGKVMQESAQTVWSYLFSIKDKLRQSEENIESKILHIHVPDGATPKDGPSAGVALLCALSSLITHRPIPHDLAMTGEVTLRGSILPVGGIKEKVIAAHRSGIKTVILPKANRADAEEIPEEIRSELCIIFMDQMADVLSFVGQLINEEEAGYHPKKVDDVYTPPHIFNN